MQEALSEYPTPSLFCPYDARLKRRVSPTRGETRRLSVSLRAGRRRADLPSIIFRLRPPPGR
ncbi:MAG TPA: hypothetical protein VEZ40_19405 [Pyrinomonadaceae bacterium]|nr:hypothetical protein [Pyrinomonadaceae bacterium]